MKERFVHKLDFFTLEKVDKGFVTEDSKTRESDPIRKITYGK